MSGDESYRRSTSEPKRSSVYSCARCQKLGTLSEPLRGELCRACYRLILKRRVERFRNLFAAGLGIAVGITWALVGDIPGVSPRGLSRGALLCCVAFVWPASFIGVYGVASLIDRFRGPDSDY